MNMDRFKFRAWFEGEGMYFSDDTISCYDDFVKDALKFEDIIMQSTGLKDTNGKLIYEGDIVEVFENDECVFVSQVKWFGDDNYPAFDLDNHDEDANYLSKVLNNIDSNIEQEIEVIGNIYENPELINHDNK